MWDAAVAHPVIAALHKLDAAALALDALLLAPRHLGHLVDAAQALLQVCMRHIGSAKCMQLRDLRRAPVPCVLAV